LHAVEQQQQQQQQQHVLRMGKTGKKKAGGGAQAADGYTGWLVSRGRGRAVDHVDVADMTAMRLWSEYICQRKPVRPA
jgi:hypothetical protein